MTYTADEQKAHRKLWVEALRSGKYRQAKDDLRNGGGFCCLGVACDISGLGEWDGHVYVTPDGHNNGELETPDIRDWLGLRHAAGGWGSQPGDSLAEMNDGGDPFDVIADIIEREPDGLISQRTEEAGE